MNVIKLTRFFAVSTILSFSILQIASAHPGRTAADGCHYCRTNCEKWGVPRGERHCHENYKPEERSDFLSTLPQSLPHSHNVGHMVNRNNDHIHTQKQ